MMIHPTILRHLTEKVPEDIIKTQLGIPIFSEFFQHIQIFCTDEKYAILAANSCFFYGLFFYNTDKKIMFLKRQKQTKKGCFKRKYAVIK